MAFDSKYRHQHTDALGRLVQVYLQKEGYSGAVTPIVLGPGGFHREDSEPGSKEHECMRPWVGHIPIPGMSQGIIDDVFSDSAAWRVRVERDGVLDLLGPILKEDPARSGDLIPKRGELIAICGLGDLQERPFVHDDGTVASLLAEGRKPWIEWVLWILNKLDLELPVATSFQWYAVQMSAGTSPLEQHYVDPGNHVRLGETPPSCYEVLRKLLSGYDAFVHQKDGAWHIYQREQYAVSEMDRIIFPFDAYDGGGSATSDTVTVHETVPSHLYQLKGVRSRKRPAYSSVEVVYEHGTVESILENSQFVDFPKGSDEGARGWDLSGTAVVSKKDVGSAGGRTVFNRSLRLTTIQALLGATDAIALGGNTSHATNSTPVAVLSGVEYALLPRIFQELTPYARSAGQMVSVSAFLLVTLVTPGQTYYLSFETGDTEATWETASSSRVKISLPTEEWHRPEIAVEAIPADGTLTVRPEPAIERGRLGGQYATTYTWWDDIFLAPSGGEENVALAQTRVIDFVDRAKGPRMSVSVYDGTGPSSAHTSADRDSAGSLLTDWKVGPYDTEPASDLSRAQLMSHRRLAASRMGADVIEVGLSRLVDVSCIKAPVISGTVYLPVSIGENYYTCVKKVVAVEVRIDDFTADFDVLAGDGSSSLAAPSGSGAMQLLTAHQGEVADLSVRPALTVLSDAVGPGTIDTLPVESSANLATSHWALKAGKFLVVAGLNGGSWQFELAADQPPGADELSVVPVDLGTAFIPEGSGVYPATGALVSVQTQTRNAIEQMIRSGGGFTELTADIDGTVNALPVVAIPFALDDLWAIFIQSSHEEALGEQVDAVVADGAEANDQSIPIASALIQAKAGDRVYLADIALQTQFLQTAGLIQAAARQSGEREAICRIDPSAGVKVGGKWRVIGELDSLPVVDMKVAGKAGWKLTFTDPAGNIQTVTVSDHTGASASELPIQEQYMDVEAGTWLFHDTREKSAELRLTPGEFRAAAEDNQAARAVAILTGRHLTSGNPYTSFTIAALREDVADNTELILSMLHVGGTVTVTVYGDHVQGAEVLNVDPVNLPIDFVRLAFFVLPEAKVNATFQVQGDAILQRVEKNDVANQLNLDNSGLIVNSVKVHFDGPISTGDAFESENYAAGSDGWQMAGNGFVEVVFGGEMRIRGSGSTHVLEWDINETEGMIQWNDGFGGTTMAEIWYFATLNAMTMGISGEANIVLWGDAGSGDLIQMQTDRFACDGDMWLGGSGKKVGHYGSYGATKQTVTGTTEQEQIDSIMDALTAVTLVNDGR